MHATNECKRRMKSRVEEIQCISAPKTTSLILGYQKLNKENIIFLWLGGVSKTRRTLRENGRLEIFSKNGRFAAKTVGLESPHFILGLSHYLP